MTTSAGRSSGKYLFIAALSAVLAVCDHIYLLIEHYDLRYGVVSATGLCNISSKFNCATVSASRYAELFGVPMALWGVAANLVFLCLLVWYAFAQDEGKPGLRHSLLLCGGAIAATSVVMGSISSFLISAYCPFCMLSYLLSFIAFGFLWGGLRAGPTAPIRIPDFVPLVILAVVFFIGGFIVNDQIGKSYGAQSFTDYAKDKVPEWEASPVVQIQPVAPLIAGASPEKAKMTIIEFADFRCPHCRHAAPVFKAFVGSHPDVRFEFEVWPLDGECNSAIPQANGASCLLARLVYCSEKINQHGWRAHEYIYENQDKYFAVDAIKSEISNIAAAAGVPADQLSACADSEDAKSTVQREAALGNTLNIQGTPTVFVNGKKLEGGQVLPVLSAAYSRIVGH